MNEALLKKLGNIDQLCSIRESVLMRGRGEGMKVLQCSNAAGLNFTVTADRCMDIYDFSYKGINFAFHSRNGLISPLAFSPMKDEFAEQWPGGFLATCGLDNVNQDVSIGGENFPTHGRVGAVPAQSVQTDMCWKGEKYLLRVSGQMQQTCMYRRNLMLQRTIETGLYEKQIRITDRITNLNASPEPVLLLYHFNFGYPLLQADTGVETFGLTMSPLNDHSIDPLHMTEPRSDKNFKAETFLGIAEGHEAGGLVYNKSLGLGCLLRFTTEHLPCMAEWKHMKACDYVLSLEPTNTFAMNREGLQKHGKLTYLEGFSSMENHLCIQMIEGEEEIEKMRR